MKWVEILLYGDDFTLMYPSMFEFIDELIMQDKIKAYWFARYSFLRLLLRPIRELESEIIGKSAKKHFGKVKCISKIVIKQKDKKPDIIGNREVMDLHMLGSLMYRQLYGAYRSNKPTEEELRFTIHILLNNIGMSVFDELLFYNESVKKFIETDTRRKPRHYN